jgi:hypothetical protein
VGEVPHTYTLRRQVKAAEEVVIVAAATVCLIGVVIMAIPDPEIPSTPVKVEQSESHWPFVVRTIMPEDLDR